MTSAGQFDYPERIGTLNLRGMMAQPNQSGGFFAESDLRKALGACRSAFFIAGFFSLFINILLLLPTIYMLQVYDRVLSSNSESTLMMLSLIAVFLFAMMGVLEWLRAQVLILSGTRLDQLLNGRVYDAIFTQAISSGGKTATVQPLQDLLQIRQFLGGQGLFAFFDAPWLPIYIAVTFFFHWAFGVVTVLSILLLVGLALWNEMATRGILEQANRESMEANYLTQRNLRNAEVIEAMGMLSSVRAQWQVKQNKLLSLQGQVSRKAGLISTMSKMFRLTIQSLILGLGAYLAIHKEITPGMVIAGSFLLGRTLAPLDLMIATWRNFLLAREAYYRLNQFLLATPEKTKPMPLPDPKGEIQLDKLVVTPGDLMVPVIKGISLVIPPGNLVAVIGASAAGKSTLARAMLGLCPPSSGSVRLDGAEITQWDREQLGRHIGYMPQDIGLLDCSVSQNIARFGVVNPEWVVAAARAAGIHEMILHLPNGYDTVIAGQGKILSMGQQQRLALARAIYGNPQVVILDEPNSNLDIEGEEALVKSLAELKRQGSTVVVISHRTNILSQVDKILVLANGQVALYGPRDQVLQAMKNPPSPPPSQPPPRPQPPTGTSVVTFNDGRSGNSVILK